MRLPGIIAGLACASAVAAAAQQVVVLKDGVAAVSLTSPKPQNLSGGAALNLTLPSATMSAQASASVGHDEGNSGFWHKDAAQVDAKVQGPLGSTVSLAGGQQLTFIYRSPASIGDPGQANHLVRSEQQTDSGSLAVPVAGVQIVVGADHSANQSQDASAPASGGSDRPHTGQCRFHAAQMAGIVGGQARGGSGGARLRHHLAR